MINLLKLFFLSLKRHPNLSRGKISILLILIYCSAVYYFVHSILKIFLNIIISNTALKDFQIVIILLLLILIIILFKSFYFTVFEIKFTTLQRFPFIKRKLVYINLFNNLLNFKIYFVVIILLYSFNFSDTFNVSENFIAKCLVFLVFNYLIFFKISFLLSTTNKIILFITLISNITILILYYFNYHILKDFQIIYLLSIGFIYFIILLFILKKSYLKLPSTNKFYNINSSENNIRNKFVSIFFLYINLFIRNKKLHNQFFTCIAIIIFYFYIFLFKQNIIQGTLLKLFILNTIFLVVPYTILNNLLSIETTFINKLFVLPNLNYYFFVIFTLNLVFSLILFIILYLIQFYQSREYFEILSIFIFDSTIGMLLGFLIIFSIHQKIYLNDNVGVNFDLVDYSKTLKLVFFFFVVYIFQIFTIGIFSIFYFKYFLFFLGLACMFCVNYFLISISKRYLKYYKYSFINNINKL